MTEKFCTFTLYLKSSCAGRIVPFHFRNYFLSRKIALYLRPILPNLPLRRVFSLTSVLILLKKPGWENASHYFSQVVLWFHITLHRWFMATSARKITHFSLTKLFYMTTCNLDSYQVNEAG